MIEGEREAFDVLFDHIYQGHTEAKRLSFMLLDVAHIWDDLVDRDKPVDNVQIDRAFLAALIHLPRHPLWFPAGLDHHVLNVFLRWRDATYLETHTPSEDDLNKAYMLRAGLYDVFVIIAHFLYGDAWAREIGPMVRQFYGETLAAYRGEFSHA